VEGADRLFPVLNDRNLYNMFLAPGQATGEETNISLAFYIESMSSFKAQTMVGGNVSHKLIFYRNYVTNACDN
jgi:hypothetical protein